MTDKSIHPEVSYTKCPGCSKEWIEEHNSEPLCRYCINELAVISSINDGTKAIMDILVLIEIPEARKLLQTARPIFTEWVNKSKEILDKLDTDY